MIKITAEVSLDSCHNKITHHGFNSSVTEKEKRLLCALLEHARNGEILNREILVRCVWPEREQCIADTNILQLVYRLRRVLHQCGLENAIKTIYRQGYTFITPDEHSLTPPETLPHRRKSFLLSRCIKNYRLYHGCLSILLASALIVITLIITSLSEGALFHSSFIYMLPERLFSKNIIATDFLYCPLYKTHSLLTLVDKK